MTIMGAEDHIRDAIIDELHRQAELSQGALQLEAKDDQLVIHGPVDLDDLIMVITGALAGGP
jgi:hypothetical protein